jgi:hypothetical protein
VTNPPPAVNVGQARGELAETAFRERARADARQVIQGMPLQPPLAGARCPTTWAKCLISWEGQNLQYWSERATSGWDRGVISAFNKRKGIHREILRFRDVDNSDGDVASPLCTAESAAKLLDRLRVDAGMNLTDHLTSRRKANPSVQSRRKTNNNPPVAPPRVPPTPTQARGTTPRNSHRNAGRQPQQHAARHAPVEDDEDDDDDEAAFARAFPTVAPPQLNQMQRERENGFLRQAQAEQEEVRLEQERQRTQGVLLYRQRAERDRRNFGDISRFGRTDYARRELGS